MGKRFDTLLFPGYRNKAFTLSYDDGVIQDRRLVRIFNDHGVKGTFNLGYGVLGYKDERHGPADVSKVEIAEVKELYKGHEIGGHGYYHSDLSNLQDPYAMYEILEDKKQLEGIIGSPLRMFAYPFGTYNEKTKELVKIAGYKGARTVKSTHGFELPADPYELNPTCHHDDEKLFELADEFFNSQSVKPLLFYVWGHAYEFDIHDNWKRIEDFTAKFDGKEDEIWFATNGEILAYLEAYRMLEYSVDGSMIYNPSCTDICILTSFMSKECLKAGTLTRVKETSL